MPFLQAHTNAVGTHGETIQDQYHYSEFNTYENRISYERNESITRISKVSRKSPTTKVAWGNYFGVPFRRPTRYHRSVEKYTYTHGIKNDSFVNHGGTTYLTTAQGFTCNFNPNDLDHENVRVGWDILDTDEQRKAVTECLLKLNKQAVNLGQFIAESKRTAEMLTDTGITLVEMLRHVKRGNIGALPKDFGVIRRGVGNYWLQWQYGWKPLCSDIYGIYEVLRKPPRPKLLHASRTVKSPNNASFEMGGNPIKLKAQNTAKCELWAVANRSLEANAQMVGVNNPLALAWELVPFSFVVDWFMPIGNSLQALTATAGLDFVGGYQSQSRFGEFQITGNVGSATKAFSTFAREPYDSFPKVGVYAERSPFTPTRAANLLAILNQLS